MLASPLLARFHTEYQNRQPAMRDITMFFAREEENGNIRVKIEGSISIYMVSAFREKLLAVLENDPGLELHLGGVTDCDTAGLQLLCSARKLAKQLKKRFSISSVPQTILEVLERAGLDPDEILGAEVIE